MLFYRKNLPIFVFFSLMISLGCSQSVSDRPTEESTEKSACPCCSESSKSDIVKQLKLDNTKTDDTELKKICSENPELLELTLSGTKITDAGLECLLQLKKLKKLRISNTMITDKGMSVLSKCERIEDLDLSQTEIGDFGVRELTALPRLKRLNLYLTKVTDSGLDAFKKGDHRSSEKIVWLNLDKCPITDAGIPKLSSLINLEWLHLGGTALTDIGLNELAKLKSLKEVTVTKTETTPEGIQQLRAVLPDCKVRDNVSEKTPVEDIEEAATYRKLLTSIREKGQAKLPSDFKGDADAQP